MRKARRGRGVDYRIPELSPIIPLRYSDLLQLSYPVRYTGPALVPRPVYRMVYHLVYHLIYHLVYRMSMRMPLENASH